MLAAPLIVLLLAAPGPAPGDFTNKPPGEERPKSARELTQSIARQEATSVVEKVGHGTLTLVRPGNPLEIQVTDVTPVFVQGRVGNVGDVKPGQEVRVSYDAMHGPPRANWIEVLPTTPQPQPKAAP